MNSMSCMVFAVALGATIPAVAAPQPPPSATTASSAVPAVSVTFEHPEKYRDVGRLRADANATLKEIATYLQKMGAMYLPPDQKLSVQIVDIDLAGEEGGSRSAGSETRIVNGRSDWPSIQLRYVLYADAKELARGEETISDMKFLLYPIPPAATQEPLPYEKRMLKDWFRARFLPKGTTSR